MSPFWTYTSVTTPVAGDAIDTLPMEIEPLSETVLIKLPFSTVAV